MNYLNLNASYSVYSISLFYYFDVFTLPKFRHICLLSLQTKELLLEAKHICMHVTVYTDRG